MLVEPADIERPPGHDYGREAFEAAKDHLELCLEWLYYHEGEQEDEPSRPDPSVATFCGCMDCEVRETLAIAWPIIELGVRSGDFDEDPS